MKNLVLLLILLLAGAINTSAQPLYSQKIPLNSPAMHSITSYKDTLLITGDFAGISPRTEFWVKDYGVVPISGFTQAGTGNGSDYITKGGYFNHTWWTGGAFQDGNLKYLVSMQGVSGWTTPYVIDSSINDLCITKDHLYVLGNFKSVDGDSMNGIFSIDILGNASSVGNGLSAPGQSGAIIGNELFAIVGQPSGYPNQYFASENLWKCNLENMLWEQIDLGNDFQLAATYISANPADSTLTIAGVFIHEFGDWYGGVGKYDPRANSFVWQVSSDQVVTADSWGGFTFMYGAIDKVNNLPVEECNLNYFDQTTTYQYNADECVGWANGGTEYLGHYATIGVVDGACGIYIVDTTTFTVTSIKEVTVSKALKVYPNPATDVLTLEGINGDISVFNILGQQIAVPSEEIGSKVRLDVKSLPTGIYTVVMHSKDARNVARFEKIE